METGDQMCAVVTTKAGLDAPILLHLLNIAEESLSPVLESVPCLSDN